MKLLLFNAIDLEIKSLALLRNKQSIHVLQIIPTSDSARQRSLDASVFSLSLSLWEEHNAEY
jgi:hypothetical protein